MPIKHIVVRYYSPRDIYGNAYDFFRYVDCATGENTFGVCDDVSAFAARLNTTERGHVCHYEECQLPRKQVLAKHKALKYYGSPERCVSEIVKL